jgi:methionyl-tRNA formyltransferase
LDKIKVLLFGLTGQGNSAFNVLLRHPFINLIGVFTKKKIDTPYPYYSLKQLNRLVEEKKILIFEDFVLREENTIKKIIDLSPDLIVVSGFDQIIPNQIFTIPSLGVLNIHPSLLPKYRGADPIIQVLLNGESETGVTVYFIESELIDSGKIVLQEKLEIDSTDTGGSLRKKLDQLSEKVLKDALALVLERDKDSLTAQDEESMSYFPKLKSKNLEITLNQPMQKILNKVRALNPYPLARFTFKGVNYVVLEAAKSRESFTVQHWPVGEKELSVGTKENPLILRAREKQ